MGRDKLTSKHVPSNTNISQTSTNERATSSLQSILGILPRQPGSYIRRLIFRVVNDLVEVLGRNQNTILDTGESVIGHVAPGFHGEEVVHMMQLFDRRCDFLSARRENDARGLKISAGRRPVMGQLGGII